MKKYSLLILGLSLGGCSLFSPSTGREVAYVNDSEIVKIDGTGSVVKAVAGEKIYKKKFFEGGEDSVLIKRNQPIELVCDGVDFNKYTFQIETNENNDDVVIKTVPIAGAKVCLSGFCQTIEWNDPWILPKIEIAKDLRAEQIVVTPLYNKNCEKYGYQIRYGSQERGCNDRDVAKIVDKFKNCSPKGTHGSVKYRTSKPKRLADIHGFGS